MSILDDGPRGAARYIAYRAGATVATALPDGVARGIAGVVSRCAYFFAGGRRRIVTKNLRRVVGEGPQLQATVRAAFASYGRYWMEFLRLPRYESRVLQLVDVEGREFLDRAMQGGKGVIVVTAHLGSYDILMPWAAAAGISGATVAEVLKPKALYEFFTRCREKFGVTIVPSRPGPQAQAQLAATLNAGGIVALAADRDLGRRGVPVIFFGEATTMPSGPARLAVLTKAPVIAIAMFQTGVRWRLVFHPPVEFGQGMDEKADVRAGVRAIAAALEDLIRRAPEQWHLFQPNWPADEPHLPPRPAWPANESLRGPSL